MKNIDQKKILNVCVVCGWTDGQEKELGGICPCCGIEWGYEDVAFDNVLKERQRWVDSKYEWRNQELKPKEWNLEKQQKNIPKEYR